MRRFYLFITALSFLILITNGVNAQTNQPQLNQVELFKQMIGRWTAEMGKDTTVFWEAKLFGTGLEDYMEFITKGKSFLKIKGLFGYDYKTGKYLHLKLYDLAGSELNAFWFTSKNICEGVPFQYLSNPENTPLKWKIEFESSDKLALTTLQNSKVVSILTFTREKK